MRNLNVLLLLTFISIGVISRKIGTVIPNVELITTITLIASVYLGRKLAVFITISILAVSDLILGTTSIFIFTWSAYILIAAFGPIWLSMRKGGWIHNLVRASSAGLLASVWFFLWTNLGVWALDTWGMYPKTLSGLIDAYILAIPFFRNNLIGNLVFVPFFFMLMESAKSLRNVNIFLFGTRKT